MRGVGTGQPQLAVWVQEVPYSNRGAPTNRAGFTLRVTSLTGDMTASEAKVVAASLCRIAEECR